MSNDYWKEFKRLVKRAEKASGGNSAAEHKIAYTLMLNYAERHAPIKSEIAARADARIAELELECAQWRLELRIYRETESKRIAELESKIAVLESQRGPKVHWITILVGILALVGFGLALFDRLYQTTTP